MFGFRDPFELMGALMPILTVVGFFVVVVFKMVFAARQKELEMKVRIAAIENGQPVEALSAAGTPGRMDYLRPLGLVFLFTGIGLSIALGVADGGDTAIWGIMPISLGIGLIAADRLNRPVAV